MNIQARLKKIIKQEEKELLHKDVDPEKLVHFFFLFVNVYRHNGCRPKHKLLNNKFFGALNEYIDRKGFNSTDISSSLIFELQHKVLKFINENDITDLKNLKDEYVSLMKLTILV